MRIFRVRTKTNKWLQKHSLVEHHDEFFFLSPPTKEEVHTRSLILSGELINRDQKEHYDLCMKCILEFGIPELTSLLNGVGVVHKQWIDKIRGHVGYIQVESLDVIENHIR